VLATDRVVVTTGADDDSGGEYSPVAESNLLTFHRLDTLTYQIIRSSLFSPLDQRFVVRHPVEDIAFEWEFQALSRRRHQVHFLESLGYRRVRRPEQIVHLRNVWAEPLHLGVRWY
jgi:hypothetical protein